MLTWLGTRSSSRRAARPAAPTKRTDAKPQRPAPPPPPPEVDEDRPPPFFADEDTAFLDMGEEARTAKPQAAIVPPPLPNRGVINSSQTVQPEVRLAQALLSLPPWPDSFASDRMQRLLEIYRALDRIAGAACSDDGLPAHG